MTLEKEEAQDLKNNSTGGLSVVVYVSLILFAVYLVCSLIFVFFTEIIFMWSFWLLVAWCVFVFFALLVVTNELSIYIQSKFKK